MTIFSLCNISICNFSCLPGIWVLSVTVPCHSLLVTLIDISERFIDDLISEAQLQKYVLTFIRTDPYGKIMLHFGYSLCFLKYFRKVFRKVFYFLFPLNEAEQ